MEEENYNERPKVRIYHFPFPISDKCENCSSNKDIKSYGENIIDMVIKNWTHIYGITLCIKCFITLSQKRDIYNM